MLDVSFCHMEYVVMSIFMSLAIGSGTDVLCSIVLHVQLNYNGELNSQEVCDQRKKEFQNINHVLGTSLKNWTFITHKCPDYKFASCINMAVKVTFLKAALVKYL